MVCRGVRPCASPGATARVAQGFEQLRRTGAIQRGALVDPTAVSPLAGNEAQGQVLDQVRVLVLAQAIQEKDGQRQLVGGPDVAAQLRSLPTHQFRRFSHDGIAGGDATLEQGQSRKRRHAHRKAREVARPRPFGEHVVFEIPDAVGDGVVDLALLRGAHSAQPWRRWGSFASRCWVGVDFLLLGFRFGLCHCVSGNIVRERVDRQPDAEKQVGQSAGQDDGQALRIRPRSQFSLFRVLGTDRESDLAVWTGNFLADSNPAFGVQPCRATRTDQVVAVLHRRLPSDRVWFSGGPAAGYFTMVAALHQPFQAWLSLPRWGVPARSRRVI